MNHPAMDAYCVIGNPIEHSKSPQIHAAFAAQTGQRLTYERRCAPLDGFAEMLCELIAAGYKGANVTVPFKLEAAQLASSLSARARAAGAVNTLIFSDGTIAGDNTDGAGLVGDIVRNAGVPLAGQRILLLGAGGAARGVLLPLLGQGPRQLTIANRTLATAEALVARFADARGQCQLGACDFADLNSRYDMIINATSASLGGAMPALPEDIFETGALALDMMYGAAPSPFMAFASAHGAQARDGLGMLVEQAAEAFALWRGVRPETGALLASLRANS
jgi:shikimate dehydrogenase